MLAFMRAWDYGMVDLDDYLYLTHAELSRPWSLKSLKWMFCDLGEGIWMPLTWLSYAFDTVVFGENFGAFHIHSILLHGCNAMLLYAFLRLLGGGRAACALGALLWAVHPLRCESVVFLASRKDVLSFFFELAALIFWVKKRENGKWLALSYVCFAAASMAKPSVMTFPVLCLLVDGFILRRIKPADYVLPLAYAGLLGVFAGKAQAAGGATGALDFVPYWYKVLNAMAAFGIYIRNTLLPADLAVQCIVQYPARLPRFLSGGAAITACVLGYLALRARGYWRRAGEMLEAKLDGLDTEITVKAPADVPFAALGWFAAAVAPMLGLASFGYHSYADRFTYIPAVGFSILVALKAGRKTQIAATAAVAALCVLTWRQTWFWGNDERLFTRTVEVDGDGNAGAHSVLANYYFEFPHDLEKCVEHFEKAIAAAPEFVECTFEIYIMALCELGRTQEVPALLRFYDKYVKEKVEDDPKFGPASPRAGFARAVYRSARVAYQIGRAHV